MSDQESLHGLACPRCGGMVEIPEGQVIIRCPYCDMRSFVRGERGLRRFQIHYMVDQKTAVNGLKRFLTSSMAIARDAARKAILSEAFLAYVPFWVMWSRALAWAFGQKRVGSGENKRYEPREVRLVEDLTWNSAALDVGEFGVSEVPLITQSLDPFQPELLHSEGMVFEPVSSANEAQTAATADFTRRVQRKSGLDRINQLFLRFFNQRFGLVYYPLWVIRYLYRDRSFQIVVDGRTGDVLYGKAPGNTLYRAAVLVLGMAAGAIVSVNLGPLVLLNADDDSALFGLVLVVVGFGIMYAAYRAFRYGEHYERRVGGTAITKYVGSQADMEGTIKELQKWVDRLS